MATYKKPSSPGGSSKSGKKQPLKNGLRRPPATPRKPIKPPSK